MSDVKLSKQHPQARPEEGSRHGEFDVKFGRIGASAPFGKSNFPMPVDRLYYEHPEPAPPRILDEERH
ncbi:hypothetical protein GCM10027447_17170 [Glycomyces halotolerans]